MRHLAKLLWVATLIAGVAAALPAKGDTLSRGRAAFSHGNYVLAARLLAPLARRGNPRAQALLGFMYEYGWGAPQAYNVAVEYYADAAEGGDPFGQYLLGLMYDKGQGVDRDDVLAYKWLNLAAAGAPIHNRERYLRIRNAVASKMSPNQIAEGQRLALAWRPRS
jgi:TPR repeat protein